MATTTKLSLAEFLSLPAEKPYRELMDGEVLQKPMPNRRHGRLVAYLIYLLQAYLERVPEAVVETEVRYKSPDGDWVFLPDISVVAAGRPAAAGDPVEGVPDLAIEVLSPDDRPGRLQRKIGHYLDSGVTLLWVVDPEEETVTVWSTGGPTLSFSGDDTVTAKPVLRDFSLEVRALFDRVPKE